MNRILASLGLTLAIAVPSNAQITDYINEFGDLGSDFGFNVCQILRSNPDMELEKSFELALIGLSDKQKEMIAYVTDAPREDFYSKMFKANLEFQFNFCEDEIRNAKRRAYPSP